MGPTALQENGEGLGALHTAAEYRGATTAACFSDPRREFAALRSACGVYDLGYRAKISLTGGDRVRWLNGMVTNNIRDLAIDHGAYAFLLNPQGRILGDLYAYNRGDSIVIDTDHAQLEKIISTFDHYIIMDDVAVEDQSQRLTALGISGPNSRSVLQSAGIAIPDMQPLELVIPRCECDCLCLECTVVRGETLAGSGNSRRESYEIWIAPAEVRKLWDALIHAGAMPVGFEALEIDRIVSGIPLYGVDIRERDLPQETEQMRALNFNKGCYIGQEIVERIRSRGAVHRTFTGFFFEGAASIAPGEKINVDDKTVGEITSVGAIRLLGDQKEAVPQETVALGYIRREFAAPGREVAIGTAKARVAQLPVELGATVADDRALEHHPA